jgi:hypothetical protein
MAMKKGQTDVRTRNVFMFLLIRATTVGMLEFGLDLQPPSTGIQTTFDFTPPPAVYIKPSLLGWKKGAAKYSYRGEVPLTY